MSVARLVAVACALGLILALGLSTLTTLRHTKNTDASATGIADVPAEATTAAPTVEPSATPTETPQSLEEIAAAALTDTNTLPDDFSSATIPTSASGNLVAVPGSAEGRPGGDVVNYRVEVEDGLPVDPTLLAANIHAVLNDPRGWGRTFNRTDGPADVRIVVASPSMVDTLCAPLATGGMTSCRNGTTVALNARRWTNTPGMWTSFGKSLTDYHIYMVNHEVGHFLGHFHEKCPSAGAIAPVMKQQTQDTGSNNGCTPNGWPNPDE